MAYKLNRSRPFDMVHGDNAEGAQTMQVQDGNVRYFGADDYEVGGEAQQEVLVALVKPEPKRRPKPAPEPAPEPVLAVETQAEQGEFFEGEGDEQLNLERQLAANLA